MLPQTPWCQDTAQAQTPDACISTANESFFGCAHSRITFWLQSRKDTLGTVVFPLQWVILVSCLLHCFGLQWLWAMCDEHEYYSCIRMRKRSKSKGALDIAHSEKLLTRAWNKEAEKHFFQHFCSNIFLEMDEPLQISKQSCFLSGLGFAGISLGQFSFSGPCLALPDGWG